MFVLTVCWIDWWCIYASIIFNSSGHEYKLFISVTITCCLNVLACCDIVVSFWLNLVYDTWCCVSQHWYVCQVVYVDLFVLFVWYLLTVCLLGFRGCLWWCVVSDYFSCYMLFTGVLGWAGSLFCVGVRCPLILGWLRVWRCVGCFVLVWIWFDQFCCLVCVT